MKRGQKYKLTSCCWLNERRKDWKSGLPKCVVDLRPVNRLLPAALWKCRSHTYCWFKYIFAQV